MILNFDVESTGIKNHPIKGHPEVIEAAGIEVILNILEDPISIYERVVENKHNLTKIIFSERYRPSMEIEEGAYKIHGIKEQDLVNCHPSDKFKLPFDTKYLLGYNISYDYRCIGKPEGIELICLMKIAKALKELYNIVEAPFTADNVLRQLIEKDNLLSDKEKENILNLFLQGQHGALLDCYKNLIILYYFSKYFISTKSSITNEEFYAAYLDLLKIAKIK